MSLFSVAYRCLFRDLVLVCCCVLAAVSSSFVTAEPVSVGRFDSSNSQPASPWQVVRFDEKIPATQFQIIDWHNRSALEAAINYVWDNKHPIGTQQNNAYTDRAKMVVQRTGSVDTGRWVDERRNVQIDVNALFNSAGAKLIQIALASDTDNTKSSARALFANLHFVSNKESCYF